MLRLEPIFGLLALGALLCALSSAAHIHNMEREKDGAPVVDDETTRRLKAGQHQSEFDHEAILGSVREAEEFDRLSPAESKSRLKMLLAKMDINADGHIDRPELHAWIMQSFKMLSEEEANDRFEDADENDDGTVTWLEYAKNSFGEDTDFSDEHLAEAEDKVMRHDKIMFDAADKNKDGFLDRAEFLVFSFPEEHPVMLPHLLAQTLEDKDKDGDGFISFEEFLDKKEGEDPDKEWLLVQEQKFNDEFDKDGDGRLNSAEIISWVVPSNEEIATDEVDHLFASADDDHDDLLSFDEVIEHHDVFVGSEVTDYGDHLHNIHLFDEL